MGIFDRKNELITRLKVIVGLEELGIAREELDKNDERAAALAAQYGSYAKALKVVLEEDNEPKKPAQG